MNILITGGTGSLGSMLTERYSALGHRVTILSRDPHKQALLMKKVPCKAILGDIRDASALKRAMHNQDVVVHAAALKRVERGATDPEEYLYINTIGAQMAVSAARDAGVSKFLLISSDKAVDPVNHYGLTKRAAETICLNYNSFQTYVSALRYGNVMDSNGSFWWVWRDALGNGKPIEVRQPYPTRFILTRNQAVELVDEAIDIMSGGEIFVPANLHAVAINEIAEVLAPKSKWQSSRLIQGEKLHEVLVGSTEHCKIVSNKLAMICDCYDKDCDDKLKGNYCSATAPRMSGVQAVKLLEEATKGS